jgi:NDP-sugar pyrophosphorylase family protein
MKAFILAAGVGTRLKPLTDTIPKALVPVAGMPMLEIVIRRLAASGIREILINVHHFADQVRDFVAQNNSFGLDISFSDESDLLLDTGGAIRKASPFFSGESLLVHNVDILTNMDYNALMGAHNASEALATLAVKERPTTRNLLVDRNNKLCGWENPEKRIRIITTETTKGLRYTAFSGIYILSKEILQYLPDENVFGFMPWIMELAGSHKVMTWDQEDSFWYEAGRLESVEQANRELVFDSGSAGLIQRV